MLSPEQRSGEIIGRRVVPVEFVFSPHGDEDAENVYFFEKRVRDVLARYTSGKLLIVTENATGIYQESVMLQLAINRGFKPSVAAATIDNLSERFRLPIENMWATPEETAEYLQAQPEYHQAQFETMDKLAQEYPGRIHWLVEESSYEKAKDIEKNVSDARENHERACDLVEMGEFSEAVPLFKKSVATFADTARWREQNLVNVIHRIVQMFPEIVGVVGQIGTSHTPVIHKLTAMGYPAKMNFSDKENLPYTGEKDGFIYNPRDAIERRLVMFPNIQLSDQEYLRCLLGFMGYRIMELYPDPQYTEQDNAFFSWDLVNRLKTEEDIQKLQELTLREKNFVIALGIFMIGEE